MQQSELYISVAVLFYDRSFVDLNVCMRSNDFVMNACNGKIILMFVFYKLAEIYENRFAGKWKCSERCHLFYVLGTNRRIVTSSRQIQNKIKTTVAMVRRRFRRPGIL